jgi:2-succinyl-5-enolpyruvyl-6-hydroxy-3-cyclohexene-1-carboxylate synthase
MDPLTFISALVANFLSLPVIILVIVLVLREPLKNLIERLNPRHVKVGPGGVEAEFLETVAESNAQLERVELQLPTDQRHAIEQIEQIRKQQERGLATLSESEEQARQRLMDLARQYEQVRLTEPSSPKRTSRLGAFVALIRAFATPAGYTPQDIVQLFNTGDVGKRIVALGTLQAIPYPECFNIVLEAINNRKSNHEQYHALRAAEAMLPNLNPKQKKQLKDAISDQRSGGPGKPITPKSDRWALSDRIFEEIKDTTP